MKGPAVSMPLAAATSTSSPDSTRATMARVLVVFGGNAASMVLGLVATRWIMLSLGPQAYGEVVVATTILFIVWQFTGKGLDQTAIRLSAISGSANETADVFGTIHAAKLIGNLLLILVGAVVCVPLTRWLVIRGDASGWPIFLAFVGAAGASLWGFFSAAIQAESRFVRYSWVQVGNNLLKLTVLGLVVLTFRFTPITVMMATAVAFFAAAGVGVALSPAYARRACWKPNAARRIANYSVWLIASSVLFLVYSRMDVLMLSPLVGGKTVGLYGGAALIAQMLDLLAASIMTVFLPRFSRHTEITPLRHQVRGSLKCSLLFALPLVPCFWLIEPGMNMLFGQEYAGAIPFLKIMYFGVLFTMVTHPLHILFYARGRQQWLTALDTLLLVFNGAAYYFAITRYGAMGAAVVALTSRLLAGAILAVGVYAELNAGDDAKHDVASNA